MKFLKSLFLKMKAKKTLKTYQQPLLVTLATLLLINIIVLFIGAGIALSIDEHYYRGEFFGWTADRYFIALIANVKWLVTPNSLAQLSERTQKMMMIPAILIVVIGMILFSGMIIATVTTALRTYIDKKSKAKGKIIVNNHFVILNWSSKVPEMIYNLMLKGFKHNIVILSDKDKEYVDAELKSLFLTNDVKKKMKTNLIIKEGDSLLRGNLEDISIEEASQICVMSKEGMVDLDDDNVVNSDLLNLKIILKLGSFKLKEDCQIVVETDSEEARQQIDGLSRKLASLRKLNITALSFNKKIGQIIAQSLVMPQMSSLYSELFSFEGSQFYSLESEQSIDEFMRTHYDAIPVHKDGQLFVLSNNEKHCAKTREQEYYHEHAFEKAKEQPSLSASIFIIGDNNKSKFLLNSLARSKEYGDFDFTYKHYGKMEIKELIADLKETEGERKVLILSDDKVSSDSYDANVFVSLIELSKAFPTKERITYITELLDSRNLSSAKDFSIQNTIISNKMMSILITQLALNKSSKKFFEKVLTVSNAKKENDFDLVISPVSQSIVIDEDMKFECKSDIIRTFYNTFEGKRILIGLVQNNEINLLDQHQDDRSEPVVLSKDDSFIYFKYLVDEATQVEAKEAEKEAKDKAKEAEVEEKKE